jgi:hypothetical protein
MRRGRRSMPRRAKNQMAWRWAAGRRVKRGRGGAGVAAAGADLDSPTLARICANLIRLTVDLSGVILRHEYTRGV